MPSIVAKSSCPKTLIDGDVDGNGGGGKTHIYLNIYDISPVNNYLYCFGLGIFHSGIEAHGTEYGFGAHEFSMSGVFEVEPKSCPGFSFKRTVWLGTTNMSRSEFRLFMEDLSEKYYGDTYHLIAKNCNHFTDEVSTQLTGKRIPGWVNRLAKLVLGSCCSCILPQTIRAGTVGELPPRLSSSDGSDIFDLSSLDAFVEDSSPFKETKQ
ncbi:deSI-like protein At4g17486 isoform X1 [Curcuma longa]|uniref:deSI-like protein At4g17486 isoform X1 n=1 Tax=Curcuma longa TaxID=136217 RepID=UPI003D9DC378